MKIDHIGYAVKRIDVARKHFELLGFSFEQVIDDYSRNVKLLFGKNGNYRIELVSKLDKNCESPVDRYLCNVLGTPYHICYSSEHFEMDISCLKKKGFKEIVPPTSAVGLEGRKVVFLMSVGIGLLEIVDESVE